MEMEQPRLIVVKITISSKKLQEQRKNNKLEIMERRDFIQNRPSST